MDAGVIGWGENALADIALCRKVGAMLEKEYPGHAWMVGADHQGGVVTIDLPYQKPRAFDGWGYLLHIKSMGDPDAERKVRHAGGELLERFGLPRSMATDESPLLAFHHGLDITGGRR